MEVALFICIIFIASILQTSMGFGFSIMATPFLLLIFAPRDAIQINLILSLLISILLIRNVKKHVNTTILKRLIIGSIGGLPIGIFLFTSINLIFLKYFVSGSILILTVLLIMKFRITQTGKKDFWIGGVSGAFTTSIGMPGPPILLYFSGTDTTKEKLRATTLAFYLFIYFVSLALQLIVSGTSQQVWVSSMWGIPIVLVGLIGGQILFRWIDQDKFRWLTYGLLLFSGLYLLIQQL
ncbi:sulfite exporter TauE/SafE family protein [Virgibacillus halodenitrificans]|uniref:sulfite exporter TauE/SafE family protein n=1 Tax=Virgibacillus halodenitrificans TaxID=1482 RepID=UPI0024BF8B24|nr:sulfite exporter TauE/SafE family protein [Virgibacillus halodenitrificans]WHX25893.1 sulfite exporter TauE/SafE family protein [Virgibacillus halodenitrificans]